MLESRWEDRRGGFALLVGVLVVVTALVAVSPLSDAVTGESVPFARPSQPPAYLFFAPLFGVWDTLSLLTLSQHYAVIVTLVALYVSLRLRAAAGRRGDPSPARRGLVRGLSMEAGYAVLALVGLLAFYAAGMLLPRPMTGIVLDDEDLLAIDFHSHTHRSHDGWGLFSAPRNRDWHEQGGFHAAYVTDHYTWRGFDEADVDNPVRSGERTVLLEGAEIRIHRRPTNILGGRARYLSALDADSVYMDPDAVERMDPGGRPPTFLYTMPGGLQYLVPFTEETPSGMIGIEINDGSPRGLEQVRRERKEILALADSVDLALIGAANLHGWGRTVASWSVMRIPGWSGLTPLELGDAIEGELHRSRRNSVQVVERRMPYHQGAPLRVALTLPWITLEHFRMLSVAERLSWLLWLGVWFFGVRALSRRSRRRALGLT